MTNTVTRTSHFRSISHSLRELKESFHVWFKRVQTIQTNFNVLLSSHRQSSAANNSRNQAASHTIFFSMEERRDAEGSSRKIRTTESQLQSTETVHNETNHGHDFDEGINGAFVEMTKDCFFGCRLLLAGHLVMAWLFVLLDSS